MVWVFALVDGSIQVTGVLETGAEYSSKQTCEKVLNHPETLIILPDDFDTTGLIELRGACVPYGDLKSYM